VSRDDTVGHIEIRPGEFVGSYRFLYEGGTGTFGKVLMCEEPKGARLVAVKVIRRIRKYVESGRVEAEILEDVSQCDPHGVSNCVRLLHSFDWRSHYCMVFEPLGKSLYDYVKANRHRPLPLYCVQHMADQLVSALGFLHQMRLVHTDLKLENVLLVNREPLHVTDKPTMYREQLGARVLAPVSTTIRLIDFGGASYDDSRVANTGTINTRQYRSPEVILGMPWGIASDVWSMGCILMELYTGELLFPTVRRAVCSPHDLPPYPFFRAHSRPRTPPPPPPLLLFAARQRGAPGADGGHPGRFPVALSPRKRYGGGAALL
jgi:serine/threonine protein kinase